jgi:hypothetical protein
VRVSLLVLPWYAVSPRRTTYADLIHRAKPDQINLESDLCGAKVNGARTVLAVPRPNADSQRPDAVPREGTKLIALVLPGSRTIIAV